MSGYADLSRLRIDRSPRPGSGRSGWVAFALVMLAAIAYLGWRALAVGGAGVPEVRVARVMRSGGADAQSGVAANGYVVARRRAALSTDIQGRIVELRVEEGQAVRKGELIARLDTTQLEAALARTRSELVASRAELELAGIEEPRARALVEGEVAPRSLLDEALARLRKADAGVRALEAAEREIRVQIEKSSVFAPFDGIIVQKNAEVGEVVSTFGSGGPSSRGAVATLVDFASLEVQVELAQTSLRNARVGSPVLIFLDAWPEQALRGRVRQIWPTADRQKATVELRVTFDQSESRALPEMGVRVVFVADDAAAPRPVEVTAPRRALLPGAAPAVLLYADGLVVRREVKLGAEERDGRVVVTAGLQGGELVVLDPPEMVKDGDPVRLPEQEGK